MFRCANCGSGYSVQAASSWQFCPRCLARERVSVPLTFELGWRRPDPPPSPSRRPAAPAAVERPGVPSGR